MSTGNTSDESRDQDLTAADPDNATKPRSKLVLDNDAEEHTARDDGQDDGERHVSKKRKRGFVLSVTFIFFLLYTFSSFLGLFYSVLEDVLLTMMRRKRMMTKRKREKRLMPAANQKQSVKRKRRKRRNSRRKPMPRK